MLRCLCIKFMEKNCFLKILKFKKKKKTMKSLLKKFWHFFKVFCQKKIPWRKKLNSTILKFFGLEKLNKNLQPPPNREKKGICLISEQNNPQTEINRARFDKIFLLSFKKFWIYLKFYKKFLTSQIAKFHQSQHQQTHNSSKLI